MKIRSLSTTPLTALFLVLVMTFLWSDPRSGWTASSEIRLSKGQTIYVPVYSNVFAGPRKRPLQLAATLSIRNTDKTQSFNITVIDYYDTNGKLVRRHLDRPTTVGPLATLYVHIEERDKTGGFGANYIVQWQAVTAINAPIVECIMIGATGGQGISFVSPGQEIRE